MFLIVFKVKHNITCSKLCFNCLASFLRPSANFLNDHILCLHVVMSQSPYWLLSSGPKFNTMIINSNISSFQFKNQDSSFKSDFVLPSAAATEFVPLGLKQPMLNYFPGNNHSRNEFWSCLYSPPLDLHNRVTIVSYPQEWCSDGF